MATNIGYQDGITAFFDWYRKQPGVPGRGPGYDPNDLSTWPWTDKMERTLRILKDDHDAVAPPPKPPNPPNPAQTYKKVAPITVRAEGGSDQMVCLWAGAPGDNSNLQPGVVRLANGEYTDDSGAKYAADGDGRENSAVRTKVDDPALVGARSMDGRNACQCPTVGDPTKNTGSWTV